MFFMIDNGAQKPTISRDLAAGLTLAAIAIPEQMATARLGGFPPELGLIAFVAATAGFLLFGRNRMLSAGADSTITPIFAGALSALGLAAAERTQAAAVLALIVGVLVAAAGALRLGRIADLLSKPVLTGFLAGVAVHILISQAPVVLNVAAPSGSVWQQLGTLWREASTANPLAILLALGTCGAAFALEKKMSSRLPGALIALAAATAISVVFGLEQRGVPALGALHGGFPAPRLPMLSFDTLQPLLGLGLMLALVVVVQTGASTRAFSREEANVNRDFIGMGAAGVMAGLSGAFPVNASPPRTAVAVEAGGRSLWTGVVAAIATLALLLFGTGLLAHIPEAALAGILLLIAMRLVHVATFRKMLRRAPEEFMLALATVGLIAALPIQTGVAAAIFLSLAHGIFTIARARLVVFEHVTGTTVWWPVYRSRTAAAEQVPGVLVVGFQAPLTFLNIYDFRRELLQLLADAPEKPRLLVLEAGGIIELDFTAAEILKDLAATLRAAGVDLAVARLEAIHARADFDRFEVTAAIGAERFFRSVAEAVAALEPTQQPQEN
ncbi:MAG: SulP family inorganic anion transporter [Betaproteobacteria bacterium]|nr:SulP family inorganic anion transporter [Betaproteobacteria bacterium]